MRVDYKLIGGRIKGVRKSRKLTQENLAERLGVTVGYVSQMERGVTKVSLDTLSEIAFILDSDITHFLSGVSAQQQAYLQAELQARVSQLNQKQKQMLFEFMDVLIKHP